MPPDPKRTSAQPLSVRHGLAPPVPSHHFHPPCRRRQPVSAHQRRIVRQPRSTWPPSPLSRPGPLLHPLSCNRPRMVAVQPSSKASQMIIPSRQAPFSMP
ncbi:hypothetical protein BS50DRAFT_416525 [Corynespora cassiicola Philippines]|uniref:Uncharacterized protein n=1 Tax=Corynespora cassiicola Philippines TaxID=1448308 RepID=A0A2T2NM75_CORCC|nr:hypothetical protein BS50DRAFT_416525 [Corynespora cassiicola Philippines]